LQQPPASASANRFDALSVWTEEQTEALVRSEEERRSQQQRSHTSYDALQAIVQHAARTTLPRRKKRRTRSWFEARRDTLLPLVEARNVAFVEYKQRGSSRTAKARFMCARAVLKREVRAAKRAWLEERTSKMPADCRHPKVFWKAAKELQEGLDGAGVTPYVPKRFADSNGVLATTDAANAEIVRSHFDSVYNRRTDVDPSVLSELRQRGVEEGLAAEPTAGEVATHLRKAKKGKAPGDNGLPVELFQALASQEDGLALIHDVVKDFWRTGASALSDQQQCCFDEWCVGRLKLLPKKGDPSNPSNWRGIMLLDVMLKVVDSIIAERLDRLLRTVGVEYQNGFRGGRGCSDAIFALKMALLKRKEHGLGSWVLFVDLVKAFDSVDRTVMLEILAKYGAPAHLVRLIGILHANVRVKFSLGDAVAFFESTVGVKQGDNMAPLLFLFVMQAAMETLEPVFRKHGLRPLQFHTAPDGVLAGRNVRTDGDEFELWAVLYADDAGLAFDKRDQLELGARLLKAHLLRFGLVMHCGRARADGSVEVKSKTEATYFPPPGIKPSNEDVAPLQIDDHRGIVTFTDRFRYLGSILTSTLTDDMEVAQRIAAAAVAFAQLKQSVFRADFGNRALPDRSKGRIYYSLVLGILLYGCESWLLTTPLLSKLKAFHHRCVRAMCGVSRCDVMDMAGGHAALFARLQVPCIERLISNRKLRWAGHVARMDIRDRLPRKFLSSWVKDVPRPRGRLFSYGHDLARELKVIGFNLDERAVQLGVSKAWITVAQERDEWRELVEPLRLVSANTVSSQGSLAASQTHAACTDRRRAGVDDSSSVNAACSGTISSCTVGSQPQNATWAARLRPRG
jgi:Reverse transcriptase (RNA-dependent DNA polymerase)